MGEKEILNRLNRMSGKLEKVAESIKKNDWDNVEKLLSQINKIENQIRKNPVSIETLMSKIPPFKKEYTSIKGKLLEQISQNNAVIEGWKVRHTEKITSSKNILDNISKYYKPTNTSYYIDKKE